ncbi:AAA family ATPase [Nocardioides sp.]|uniref:AAA family ATPase n=1 Tax=Nocardioides sp. TaxID=35761 RepID=UPI0035131E60
MAAGGIATVVGRAALLDDAWAVLADGGTVLVAGHAGIGKSAVRRELVRRAEQAGWTVLACAPAEAEAQLPLAAVADLLHPLADVVDRLAAPQRAAAEAILFGVASETGPIPDRAYAAAVRALLLEAARRGPVLVAVDDAPWLDAASEAALRFALRRTDLPVLVCARTGGAVGAGAPAVPLGLEEGREAEPSVLHLGPLAEDDVRLLVLHRFGDRLPAALASRIAAESGGVALVAIELARAALRAPRLPRATEPLPAAGGSVMALARAAVVALPAPSQEALTLAALLGAPTLADLARAGVAEDAWWPAVEAEVLTVDGAAVAFAHPTYAAAARDLVPLRRRAELQRRLADAVADPDERARQLAAATTLPDATAAAEIEASAVRQRARGLRGVEAALLTRAAEVSPVGTTVEADLADQRWARAGAAVLEVGDLVAAATVGRRLLAGRTPTARAEGAMILGTVVWSDATADPRSAYEIALLGLPGLPPESAVAGRLHLHLSVFAPSVELGIEHGRAAVAALDAADPPTGEPGAVRAEHIGALFQLFHAEVGAGLVPRVELIERGLALERVPSEFCAEIPALHWMAIDDIARARGRLDLLLRTARAQGADMWQLQLLVQRGLAELLADRYDAALAALEESERLGRAAGADLGQQWWIRQLIAVRRGDVVDPAAPSSHAGPGEVYRERLHHHLRALVAHAEGRHAEAVVEFAAVAALAEQERLAESATLRLEPDRIESLVAVGRTEEARQVLAGLRARQDRFARPWATLGIARAEVLLSEPGSATERGALARLEEAVGATPPDVVPYERGRSLLLAGEVHARAGRPEHAARCLTEALAVLEAVGAARLAARARAAATARARTDVEEVRRVLRGFHRPTELAASPLATGVGVEPRAESVRALVRSAADRAFGDTEVERELRGVLETGYLDPEGGHTRAMRRLALTRATYYRRLAEATDRLAAVLAAG